MVSRLQDLLANNSLGGTLDKESVGFASWACPTVLALENVVCEIAPTSIPILLVGESGTGKQLFAHRIHLLSSHSNEAFSRVACASVNPEGLLSELGLNAGVNGSNEKTSEMAAGTVFLDEISELDAACQRSLLYALPDGGSKPHPGLLMSRIISTTSRNLEYEMRAGRFRSELYYRINGVCLRLPPLRERKEDIPLLAEFFLTKHAAQFGRRRPSLSQRTLRIFLDHQWPGNIRELENVVKNIVALGDEQIAVSELVSTTSGSRAVATEAPNHSLKAAARAASREAERELILKALARTRWNRKRAAQDLQISYKSLLYKLKQIGLEDTESN
jgi:DNA-binding NtrC family response regulator